MRSRTHGTETALLKNGEFKWVWYRLLPRNVVVNICTPALYTGNFQLNGSLPQAAVYQELTGLSGGRFDWAVGGTFAFSVRPDALPALTDNGVTDQAGLDAWQEERAKSVRAAIERAVFAGLSGAVVTETADRGKTGEAAETAASGGAGAFFVKGAGMQREIADAFPELENVQVNVNSMETPDFELYNAAMQIYNEYVAKQRESIAGQTAKEAESRILSRFYHDKLEKTGEIITKYPLLIEYLKIEAGEKPSVAGAD
jgi:hypothetical protein